MTDEAFDEHRLSERLSKLNSSQQSIESLSKWCVSHRKKAKQIVEAWDKTFNAAQRDQRVSLLYLSNDILQISRRSGSEFVNEFWKVLPNALKNVYGHGDDRGKKAAFRLVDIWEQRKVFGSRGQNLKDQMLGMDPPPPVSNGNSSNAVKIMKRDAHSLRVKMAVGGMPEKIMTAFLSVHDENINEEESINRCRAVGGLVGEMMKDAENKSTQGGQHQSSLVLEIQEQESVLEQSIQQLENAEAARSSLVSQLNDALNEQEMKLADIRAQLQVARGQIEEMSHMRQRLSSSPIPPSMTAAPNNQLMGESMMGLSSAKPPPTSTPPPPQPVASFATLKTSEEDNKKAAAAAVAAKLAASTSSAQMLTSVLSSLVAEEAASRNGSGQKPTGFSSSLPMFSPEKRQKLENPMAPSDQSNPDMGNSSYFTSMPPNMPPMPPTSMHNISQSNQLQAPYPPLPPITPASSSPNQFVQSAGMMVGVMPYGYGANGLPPPPPPPLPSHIAMGLARPGPLPLQPPQQPPQQSPQHQQQQQLPASGGYYRPAGTGFYGQTTPPPVPRQ